MSRQLGQQHLDPDHLTTASSQQNPVIQILVTTTFLHLENSPFQQLLQTGLLHVYQIMTINTILRIGNHNLPVLTRCPQRHTELFFQLARLLHVINRKCGIYIPVNRATPQRQLLVKINKSVLENLHFDTICAQIKQSEIKYIRSCRGQSLLCSPSHRIKIYLINS